MLWPLVKKELRLLARDRLSFAILVLMPLGFILVLGLLLGEGFGQRTDSRLRVSLVDLDEGFRPRQAVSWLSLSPASAWGGPQPAVLAAVLTDQELGRLEPWSKVVQRDLAETAEIRVEIIGTREEAQRLVQRGSRPAVFIMGPEFSHRVQASSFISRSSPEPGGAEPEGLNPFYRDGVSLRELGSELLMDRTQLTAASIIDQVCQVTLLRVVLPWMIGRAFERLADPAFIERLGENVRLPNPIPEKMRKNLGLMASFLPADLPAEEKTQFRRLIGLMQQQEKIQLKEYLLKEEYRRAVGLGVQNSLSAQFGKYDLTAKTWAGLTRSAPRLGSGAEAIRYQEEGGVGLLRRGAARYQILVPSYTVLFAFSLVLTVGWLFVLERRNGTLKRLRVAPVTRGQILLGKFLPCFLISVLQGLFLLVAGKLIFGMTWGPGDWTLGRQAATLSAVVLCTSLAAIGLSMFVAALCRTEIQVALVGSLLVLFLGLVSGCLIPRELLPESMAEFSRLTPHAWALDAYRQLLTPPSPGALVQPNLAMVFRACGVLVGFGLGFLALAWLLLRTDGD